MSGKGYFTTFAKLLAIASLCCAAAAAPAAAAPTKVTKCKGQLAAGSYDSVVVPQNATCSLSGANVAGNVTMERRATLNGGSVTIGGSLLAQGATNVRLFDFSVGGDVRIVGGGGDLVIQSSTVHGVIDIFRRQWVHRDNRQRIAARIGTPAGRQQRRAGKRSDQHASASTSPATRY